MALSLRLNSKMEEQSTNDCGSEFHIWTILTAQKLLRQDAWHRGFNCMCFRSAMLLLIASILDCGRMFYFWRHRTGWIVAFQTLIQVCSSGLVIMETCVLFHASNVTKTRVNALWAELQHALILNSTVLLIKLINNYSTKTGWTKF